MSFNCVVILGPTAAGKTSLGVSVANYFGGEIISADSRQTYKKLDIGSGKDLSEYSIDGKKIPYHLIDIAELPAEYTVYDYQKDFYNVFNDVIARKKLPVVVGGTGMYLDAVIRNYDFVNLPENNALRKELEETPLEILCERLLKEQPNLHVKADLQEKERVIKAIEIIEAKKAGFDTTSDFRPEIKPYIIGATLPREQLWENISVRLKERLENGMLEEVLAVHNSGISWERLEKLGLEYRFCSLYLQEKIATKQELYEKLFIAIRQFSKRQQTWFRMMEKKGVKINWLDPASKAERAKQAIELISKQEFC